MKQDKWYLGCCTIKQRKKKDDEQPAPAEPAHATRAASRALPAPAAQTSRAGRKVLPKKRPASASDEEIGEVEEDDCGPVSVKLVDLSTAIVTTHGKPVTYTTFFTDQPLGRNKVGELLKGISSLAGLPESFTNHSLRATFITSALRAGIPIERLMLRTGHRSEKGLLSYKHNDLQDERAVNLAVQAHNAGHRVLVNDVTAELAKHTGVGVGAAAVVEGAVSGGVLPGGGPGVVPALEAKSAGRVLAIEGPLPAACMPAVSASAEMPPQGGVGPAMAGIDGRQFAVMKCLEYMAMTAKAMLE